MRKQKVFLVMFAIIFCTLIIHTHRKDIQKEDEFSDILYGIPTYENSRFSRSMSSLNSNPFIAVFLTNDSHEKIVAFYKKNLKVDFEYNEIEYRARSVHAMTVYQFKIQEGVLVNQISKGVEIIPYNSFNRRVFKAKTKIKILLPLEEVEAFRKKDKESKREEPRDF
ncbi:MAG: hypothetical protein GY757_10775 [bacterium]|nr:hypothetical protein [bacterium]